jgi:hypothetical protein
MSTINSRFVTAGRAIFTVSNPKGERYTFKITRKEDDRGVVFFAALLTGSDNEHDYTYMGLVSSALTNASVRVTRASRYTQDSKPVAVLAWALAVVNGKRQLPEGYAIRHEGRCGRCGRTLTVPESIDNGIGPECAAIMGAAA